MWTSKRQPKKRRRLGTMSWLTCTFLLSSALQQRQSFILEPLPAILWTMQYDFLILLCIFLPRYTETKIRFLFTEIVVYLFLERLAAVDNLKGGFYTKICSSRTVRSEDMAFLCNLYAFQYRINIDETVFNLLQLPNLC